MHVGRSEAPQPGEPARWPRTRRKDRRVHERDFEILGGTDAPATARAAVDGMIDRRVDRESRENVALMVSEIVTNSVLHGGGEPSAMITVSVTLLPSLIRVEVSDPRGGFERPSTSRDPLTEHGHGLDLVSELASRWGVRNRPDGRVWFELDSPA